MKPFHILLIGNGEAISGEILRKLAKQADQIIAADGGAGKALEAKVVPDWVIGDLDSISKSDSRVLRDRIVQVPSQQNTDLEKALTFITDSFPVTQLTLVGFLGGRWDFSLGNILHLISYAKKMDITLTGNGWHIHLLTHEATFPTKLKKRISLIPLAPCTGVTLTGLKYPLAKESLPVGTTRSLSNQTVSRQFSVRLKRGILLLYREI